MRKGELLALTWDDIDYKNNTISINKSTAVLHGKQITKAPKTHSSIRTITIPQSLTELIKQYRKAQAAERLRLGSYWLKESDRAASESLSEILGNRKIEQC